MIQYQITLTGLTPLLMHADNLVYAEKLAAWRNDPSNRELSTAGDDRSPAWTWLCYCYHDTRVFGVPSDNLMTMLREGGAKVKTGGKSNETYKKHTQSGIMIDQQQWPIIVKGGSVDFAGLWSSLMGVNDFAAHVDAAETSGFELLVKRAKIGQSKHVRVRAMFRNWQAVGSLTVLDEELSGLDSVAITRILQQGGSLVGLGDWRPSSPRSPGTFGKFSVDIQRVA